ncbi:hypothetical protein [Picosynechococcus sp. PCC 73109]|uniref:hypothetical protein n=1 Tax=Picosynechococcus sp. PCC 73109 TaxID=374982 RepID=UPI00074589CC|nr:hypothetical protein [Picosynechococcus sp. PCC 73109]AMA10806.1 hypothetical protein AWQ23_15320 [Picosynechococcus sp. PCC 73109]
MTTESTHPCLPALLSDRTSIPAVEPGKFNSVNLSQIKNLADDLDFEASDDADIHSIPSPWARPLQFMAAISDRKYKARAGLLRQYRGFLAALALSEYLNLSIRAQEINLAKEELRQTKLSRALITLKPDANQSVLSRSFGQADPWLKPYVFYCNDHVLGMTSPATLVTPAPHVDNTLGQQIHWIKGNRFTDPTQSLSSRERYVVIEWLKNLCNELNNVWDSGNRELINSLIQELQDFANDLGGGQLSPIEINQNEDGFGILLEPAPLKYLAPMKLAEEGSAPRSNVQILPSVGFSPERPIYLIDQERLPAKLGHRPGEIIVYGTISLQIFNPVTHGRDDAYFLKPEDFFLDELFYIEGDKLLPGTWITDKLNVYDSIDAQTNRVRGAKTLLLPLNPLLKHYFASPDLEKVTSLSLIGQGSDRRVRVSLKVPLSGHGSKPIFYEVSKEFPLKPENSLSGAIPVVGMWPNVPVGTWKQFFVFTDASENVETAFSLAPPTVGATSFFRNMGQQARYQYWECPQHPNILEAVNADGRPLGVLPLRIPRVQLGETREWTVGVDFGTSFTNLAVRRGNGEPQWLDLQTQMLSITEAPLSIRDRAYREMFVPETFIKDERERLPMATLLTTIGWTESSSTAIPEPLKEARIFVPRLDKFDFNVEHVKSNIKWDQIRFQDPFLRHLQRLVAAQAALEGVTSVTWVVSYPSAFSPHEEQMYFATWKRTLRDMEQITYQRHLYDENIHRTESIAFAEYYRNVCAGVEDNLLNTICVDIGGGTSDIAIFRDSQVIYQTSVAYAGRDIYHRLLKLNLNAIGDVFGLSERDAKSLQEVLKGNNFNSALDNYLRGNGRKILEGGYAVNASKQKNKEFRTLLVFAIGGLYHYLGLVQKYASQDKNDCTATVFVGGNGSRFLDWLTPTGEYNSSSEINKVLLGVMERSSELKPNPKSEPIQRTVHPKSEVCEGLIIPQESTLQRVEQSNPLVGEICEVNGKEFAALDVLDLPETWEKITSFNVISTQELERYIQNFNQIITQERIGSIQALPGMQIQGDQVIPEDLKEVLQQVVKDTCQKKLGKKEDFELESTFLLQLRCFMDILASRWARNNGGK